MFIERNEDGEICGAYANPQPGKELEFLKLTDKELEAFLKTI